MTMLSLHIMKIPEMIVFLISSSCFRKQVMKSTIVKQLKEIIYQREANLQKLMKDTDKIWEDTGLDPKETPSNDFKILGKRFYK
jgi:hypothetical protein